MSVAGLAFVASLAGVGGSTAHAAFAQQGPKLTATGETGNGDLGWSVALSADGNTALVAAPSDDSNKGAAFVFTRSGTTWAQQAKLANPTGMTGAANFGTAVALSADGNTALVGGSFDGGVPNVYGAAWVFTRSGTTWTQQGGKLQPNDETGAGQFGLAAALSSDGNTAAIGGVQDNSNAGAGWIFTRSGSTWTQQGSKLTGAGGVGEAFFGRSASLSGDGNTVVFGGPGDNSSAGAAWVFTRSGSTWTAQGGKLLPNDAVGAPEFGSAISMSSDGTTMLVAGGADGNPRGLGAAWVFTRSGTTWTQQGSKLRPNDEVGNGFFGFGSLSSDGNIAVIAGVVDNNNVGAAWIFARSGGVWTQRGSKLTGSGATGAPEMGDGTALSADGMTALIGGTRDNGRIGAAWVFFGTPEPAPGPGPPVPPKVTGVTPDTTITSGPDGFTSSPPVFTFTSTIAGSTFECSIDSTGFEPCTTPLKPTLANGQHTFRVRAISPVGVADPSPAVRGFTLGEETQSFSCEVEVPSQRCVIRGECPARSECLVASLGMDVAGLDPRGSGWVETTLCHGSGLGCPPSSKQRIWSTECSFNTPSPGLHRCPWTEAGEAVFGSHPIGKFAATCTLNEVDRGARGHATCTVRLRIKPAVPLVLSPGPPGRVTIFAPSPGTLSVSAAQPKAGRAARRRRRPRPPLASVRVRVKGEGFIAIPLKLSKRSKAKLRRRHRLRLLLRLTFAPPAGKRVVKTQRLTIRQPVCAEPRLSRKPPFKPKRPKRKQRNCVRRRRTR
jgi:FG-GAP repeat protein